MQHGHVLKKKLKFGLLTPSPVYGVSVGGICYRSAAILILFNSHVLKKVNFDLLTPYIRSGGGMGGGSHAAAFVILFYLICNMTMF